MLGPQKLFCEKIILHTQIPKQVNMNIQRPEHLDTQYIYRDYGGYIFKLPRNKELSYQSIETQEYYYWTLAELSYKQLVASKTTPSGASIATNQVAGWQLEADPVGGLISSTTPMSRYIQVNEVKKSQRDKLIAEALFKIYKHEINTSITNPFQFIETVS
jgi:hypothetical protein